jgi:2-polyprenyl-3-methyl-5-hydroxy-6-metoxy-1,4-benzoquinol methylase
MLNQDDREKMDINRRYWEDVVAVHAGSRFYDVPGFIAGENRLDELERGEVGDVNGKSLLHLQCHFGLDTLSWARLGARVTGVDYSREAVETARSLARECGLDARFIQCNLYDLPGQLDEQFDVVFTSYGVLSWLPDIRAWARIAASYVKPGGFFYIAEFHPFAYVFNDEADHLEYRYPYFNTQPTRWEMAGTYTGAEDKLEQHEDWEWAYRLGDVVTALIDAGLRLEFLHEHPFTVYEQFPFLVKTGHMRWGFPGGTQLIPLMFSLKAGNALG